MQQLSINDPPGCGQVHDALCAVSRTLESNAVVPGGGAVETALSLHLEDPKSRNWCPAVDGRMVLGRSYPIGCTSGW